jgi:dTDP-4-amino-4,6-dideoxygalactose transaminase
VVAMTTALPLGSVAGRQDRHRWIPALPTLWPSMLTPLARRGTSPTPDVPFPFGASRAYRWYLARNAVYHGARLLGLGGSEVLVPAYHHGVEIAALVHAGCVPRFVRVDAGMRLDVEELAAKIGPRTGAIYVIHYAGFPQPMDEILQLAGRAGLPVIEDCALALLSRDGARPLGSRGDLAMFCLYKTLPVPNGGLLVVNRAAAPAPPRAAAAPLPSTLSHVAGSLLANAALRLGKEGEALRGAVRRIGGTIRSSARMRHVGTGTSTFEPNHVHLGMSGLSGHVLRRLDWQAIVEARRRNYGLLLSRLRRRAPVIFAELAPGVCPLFYPLLCPDETKKAIQEKLAARAVESVDFWSRAHPSCEPGRFPEVEALRRRVLELPIHQDLEPDDVARLAEAVEECLP